MTPEILPQYRETLSRPSESLVSFSDVFPHDGADFDAVLTTDYRSLALNRAYHFGIGHNPKLGDYGTVLIEQLLADRRKIVEEIVTLGGDPEIDLDRAARTVVNVAPRDSQTTAEGKNGKDFYLAITAQGQEIYAVPPERLQALETRNQILACFQIPTENLPFTDGAHEQFRSSIVAIARYKPEVLVPVFQYRDRAALIAAKAAGTHPDLIPEQEHPLEVAYVDKFGNVRLSAKDVEQTLRELNAEKGDKVLIQVGDAEPLEAYYVDSLAEIPNGELGFYCNVADGEDPHSRAGYFELVKKSEDCNHETDHAESRLAHTNTKFWEAPITIKTAKTAPALA